MQRHFRFLQVGCSVLVFTSSSFKTRLYKGLYSTTLGCYRSDVASYCNVMKLNFQNKVAQGPMQRHFNLLQVGCSATSTCCIRAYKAPLTGKVVTGRIQRLSLQKVRVCLDFGIFKDLTDNYCVKIFIESNLRQFSSPICFCFLINSLVRAVVSVKGESLFRFWIP